MVFFDYKDFNEIYNKLSRLPCLEYDKYEDEFVKVGSTYHMKNVIIHSSSFDCDIRMDKLNYTISK